MDISTAVPLRLLLVDDHEDTVALTARWLQRQGIAVCTARSCAEALEVARAVRVDVLVTDIGLIDGDGCDLLAEVRGLYPVRAIALTGYVYADDIRRSEQAGFDAVLSRPVAFDALTDAIGKLILRRPDELAPGAGDSRPV